MSKILIVGGSKGIGKKISEILENKECIIFSRNNDDSANSNHHYYNLDVNNGEFPEIEDLSSIIYVTVPITGNDDFDNSLENFSKNVRV